MNEQLAEFLYCVMYLTVCGILGNVIGEALPRACFNSERFPLSARRWECGGAAYERLHIRRWKDKLPDMSRILRRMFPKRLPSQTALPAVERLIQETRVAESVHGALIVAGLGCFPIWPGFGGLVVFLLWALAGQLPFIMIQRYNRPRLQKLAARMERARRRTEGALRKDSDESLNLNVQYR